MFGIAQYKAIIWVDCSRFVAYINKLTDTLKKHLAKIEHSKKLNHLDNQ